MSTICPVGVGTEDSRGGTEIGGHFLPTGCLLPLTLAPRSWGNLPSPQVLFDRATYQLPEPTMQTFLPAMVTLL